MKVAVVGAGGVGGYIGGRLALTGNEVVLIARGAHLKAIQAEGLKVKSINGNFEVRVAATDRPETVGPVDLVIFAVKSYDTESAAAQIRPMVGPNTAVLTVQNGVDNEEKLVRFFGPERVLGGVVYIDSYIEAPGVIAHTDGGRIVFAELNGRPSERAALIKQTLEAAGIPAEISEDIAKVKWTKLLFNCALNSMTALARCYHTDILQTPEGREVFVGLIREAEAVARARGINLDPDVVEKIVQRADNLPPSRSSMLYDVLGGKPLEVDALNGVIVRYGREVGVPTPFNQALYGTLKVIDKIHREGRRTISQI
jgi:2-dehydropantoate 2-reductase